MLPASAITVDVEAPIQAGDLLVLTLSDRYVSQETMHMLKEYIEQLWPEGVRPKVLVLLDGCTLQVHRGIVKVELPARDA